METITLERTAPRIILNDRPRQALIHAAEGLTAAQIAERMACAKRTVDWHLAAAYLALGVSNRIQAINRARQLGLI